MASTQHRRCILTERDGIILRLLDRLGPLTADDLLLVSRTTANPFTTARLLRRRLQALADAGLVGTYRYATTRPGNAPQYYKLTLESYRLVVGDPSAQPPSKRHFQELGISLHDHTRTLAAINVHTLVSAYKQHIVVSDFHRENTLSFTAAGATIKPDTGFTLAPPTGKSHTYRIELDNGTEPIVRKQEGESIDRKLRAYDEDRAASDEPYHVVFFCRSWDRAKSILRRHAAITCEPRRRLVVATTVDEYLSRYDPLYIPLFRDHRCRPFSLVPQCERVELVNPPVTQRPLAAASPVC